MNTSDDLKILQSLPLEVKIMKSKQRIKEWYNHWNGDVYIAFSGGKDSTVLKDLVHSIYPDVPVVFCDTGLEFKGVRKKGIENSDIILKPELDFLNIIRLYGYPFISKQVSHSMNIVQRKGSNCAVYRYFNGSMQGSLYDMSCYAYLENAPFRISDKCCIVSKKNPSHKYSKYTHTYPFVGTLANESRLRKTNWLHNGCNMYDNDSPTSAPLSFWTEKDILQYILDNKLDIAEEYGIINNDGDKLVLSGEQRTGCIYCGYGIGKDNERFLRLKEYDKKLYDYVLGGGHFENGLWMPYKGLGYAYVIDWLNKYGNMNIKY